MDRRDEAANVYLDLINRNPENWAYYKGLEDSVKPGMIIHIKTFFTPGTCLELECTGLHLSYCTLSVP